LDPGSVSAIKVGKRRRSTVAWARANGWSPPQPSPARSSASSSGTTLCTATGATGPGSWPA